jgi:LysR family cys regulon transcriptional activator
MNIQQLRYLSEVAEQDLNLSKAALTLHTSQPGISRQIRLMEEELKAELLVRQGNRIAALTEPGRHAVEISRRILRELDNLKKVGADAASETSGSLVIATTHVHARYVLIPVVRRFQLQFPQVHLSLRQGNPDQIVKLVHNGEADLGICTAPTMAMAELANLPWAHIRRCVLVPTSHPLLKKKKLTLAHLAQYPMITLDRSFAGGVAVMSAFAAGKIAPNVVLSATDADVIKAFVASGMGIATLPEIAFDAQRDAGLQSINARHLFHPSVSYLWVHRHHYLRGFASSFIQMLAPSWTRAKVDLAMRSAETVNEDKLLDMGAQSAH